MRTCTQATNSAASRRYRPATAPSVTTSQSAACTMLLTVTTSSAEPSATNDSSTNRSWTTLTPPLAGRVCDGPSVPPDRLPGRRAGPPRLGGHAELLGRLSVLVERRRCGHGPHPVAQPVLLVGQLADVELGVLELRAPVQRVERAGLHADRAVHAQREVDREPVEHVPGLVLAALGARRDHVLVGVDVDAPGGTLPCAQHARGAVLLDECDHPPGAGRELGHRVGVVRGDRTPRHRAHRHRETLDEAGSGHLHCCITTTTEVSASWTSARGTSPCQARRCSWSSRIRGYATRTQITTNATTIVLRSVHSHPSWASNGPSKPPRNSTVVRAESTTMPAYSARMNSANRSPPYSV